MFWIIGGGEIFRSIHAVFNTPFTKTIYDQLEHVKWEGFHFLDLIYPLFLFIVGAVMPFSLLRQKQQQSHFKLYWKIIKRTFILILLGMMANGLLKFEFQQMRWMGVLQRIGLCYFFAAILVINTKWRTQAIFTAAGLLVYWALMALVPVPNFGAGDYSAQGCLSTYIDQRFLPGIFNKDYYGFGESQGILSTLPAICSTVLGVLAGNWLRSNNSQNRKTIGLIIAGIISLIAGYVWGIFFPIIKNVWTSSYVLVSGGYSLLLLALFYWIIDVKGYKKWAFFFIVIGMNAIFIYFLPNIIDFNKIANFFITGLAEYSGILAPIVLTITVLTIKWLFLLFLYRRKIFIKI